MMQSVPPEHAHDGHVVHRHAHVLGVVQSRDLDLPSLPSKECAEQLKIGIFYAVRKAKRCNLGNIFVP